MTANNVKLHLVARSHAGAGNRAERQCPWIGVIPLFVRISHWVNALAVLIMVTSGWRIYNASPLFDFRFPHDLTLGGWLGGALQWHFAALWLLAANGLMYLVYGVASGYFKRNIRRQHAAGVAGMLAGFRSELARARLSAGGAAWLLGNAMLVLAVIALLVSGLALSDPIQFMSLVEVMGGYEGARLFHFLSMALAIVMVLLHVAAALLAPRATSGILSGAIDVGWV